jgi:hypothetical protein
MEGMTMSHRIEFHFNGGSAELQQLPVEHMINLLSNIKELAYLIVAHDLGASYNERFNPSKEIRDNCVIKCELPTKGSYAQAIILDYASQRQSLFNETENPATKIIRLLQHITDNKLDDARRLITNGKLLKKALDCVTRAFPKLNDDIYVTIPTNNYEIDGRVIQRNATAMIDIARNNAQEHMIAVIGRLVSIDFDERKIIIVYPATKRALDCFYNEDIEDMLYENRRGLVQVIGNVVMDESEQPKKITGVIDIQEVDLSPIAIGVIDCVGKTLKFRNQLLLTPTLDESEQLYTINYPDLVLELFAYTRKELIDDIKADIAFLWEEYAKANDGELTADAQDLKRRLTKTIEETIIDEN